VGPSVTLASPLVFYLGSWLLWFYLSPLYPNAFFILQTLVLVK